MLKKFKKYPAWEITFLSSLIIFSTVLGLQMATEYLAWRFNFHPSLGFNIHHIYPCWDAIVWDLKWNKDLSGQFSQLFNDALWITTSIFALGITISVFCKRFFRQKAHAEDSLHGSAHWATREDIENASLLPKKGAKPPKEKDPTVYVGAWKDPKTEKVHYLTHSGPEHILVYAPTRSGKGVGLVIPTLLRWSQSVVVWDIKGELAALTSGWRKKYAKNNIFVFKPMVKGFSRWNPLEEIRIGSPEFETNDIQQLAQVFANPDGEKIDHWKSAAINGFEGLIAFEIYRAKAEGDKPSLLKIAQRLSNPDNPNIDPNDDEPEKQVWRDMLKATEPKEKGGWVEPDIANLCRMNAQDFINTPDKEYGSKMSTLGNIFTLFRNKIIAENVSECDFFIDDLMNAEKPSTLYFVVESTYHEVAKPIIKVFFNMMIQKLCKEQKFEGGRAVANYKHRLLCLFDEFTSLGKIPAVLKSFPFAAGYGLKYYVICQATSQLVHVYGKGEADDLLSNCNIKITYASNDTATAEEVQKMSGISTVVKESISESLSKNGKVTGTSRSFQETQRPLITADEAMRLKAPLKNGKGDIIKSGDMLIFPYGYHPIFGTQILYFKDPALLARAKVPCVAKPDTIIHVNDNRTVENLAQNLKGRPSTTNQTIAEALNAEYASSKENQRKRASSH